MTFKEIQELIKQFGKSELADLKIEKEGFKIRLRKPDAFTKSNHSPVAAPQVSAPQPAVVQPAPQQTQNADKPEPQLASTEKPAESTDGLLTVKSPMIGTFYRSPGPDKDAFVKVGDEISKGSVLCIIEAMKLFNEIESEHEGKIVKVLVEDASPVEYDQPLFLIEPPKK